MSVLERAELLLQAKNYSGSGNWLDAANSHDATISGVSFHDGSERQYIANFGEANNNLRMGAALAAADIDVEDVATLACWIRFRTGFTSTNDTAMGTHRGIGPSTGVRIDGASGAAHQPRLIADDAVAEVEKNHTSGLSIDVWHHVASVIDHRAGTHTMDLYVDGVKSGASADISALGNLTCDADGITIGARRLDSQVANFDIAYTEMYKDLATGAEVLAAFNGGVGTGISGLSSVVSVVDFNDRSIVTEPFASLTDPQGNTFTLFRAATGRKLTVVDRPLFVLASNDYFEIPDGAALDFAAGDSFTLMVAGRHYDVSPSADSVLVFKKDDLTTSAGYGLYLEAADATAKMLIGDGTLDDEDATPNLTAGEAFVVAGVRDTSGDDIEAFTDGIGSGSPVIDSTTVTLANAFPMRIGATSNVAASFLDGEIHAVVLWREALSDADVATATDELNGIFAETVTRRLIRSPRYGITRMATR